MVQVQKRENESTGSLLRRFTRSMRFSAFLKRARAKRFYEPERSEFQKKKEALRRVEWQKNIDRLRKLGKAD